MGILQIGKYLGRGVTALPQLSKGPDRVAQGTANSRGLTQGTLTLEAVEDDSNHNHESRSVDSRAGPQQAITS